MVIDKTGKLIIRVPLRTPLAYIERALDKNRTWIHKSLSLWEKRELEKPKINLADGELINFYGNSLKVVYCDSRLIEILGSELRIPQRLAPNAKVFIRKFFRTQADTLIRQRVTSYSQFMELYPTKVTMKDTSSRWGSCSGKKLAFCWRLIFAPPKVLDYVVVHELAHIAHPNHGVKFWQKVEAALSDYESSRRWLKLNGHKLAF